MEALHDLCATEGRDAQRTQPFRHDVISFDARDLSIRLDAEGIAQRPERHVHIPIDARRQDLLTLDDEDLALLYGDECGRGLVAEQAVHVSTLCLFRRHTSSSYKGHT